MKLGGWLLMLTAMMLFLTFIGIPTIFSDTLSSFGITTNSTTGQLTSIHPEDSTFWQKLFNSNTGILAVLVGGSLIIGLFAKGYDVSLILVSFVIFVSTTFIATFVKTIVFVASYGQTWLTALISLIFGSLMVGFIMANVDYFGGGAR